MILVVELTLVFVLFTLCTSTVEGAAKFEQAKASSTQGPQFDASQALQAGPSYWCSAGNHPDDEQGVDCFLIILFCFGFSSLKT